MYPRVKNGYSFLFFTFIFNMSLFYFMSQFTYLCAGHQYLQRKLCAQITAAVHTTSNHSYISRYPYRSLYSIPMLCPR